MLSSVYRKMKDTVEMPNLWSILEYGWNSEPTTKEARFHIALPLVVLEQRFLDLDGFPRMKTGLPSHADGIRSGKTPSGNTKTGPV